MDHLRLDATDTTLVLVCSVGSPPSLLYWGARLPDDVTAQSLADLSIRQGMHGVADVSLPLSLAMDPGLGHPMMQCFAAHRAGKDWGSLFEVGKVEAKPNGAIIKCRDNRTRLGLEYDIDFDPVTGV